MYEGLTRLLIVFLTHPGILVSIPANGIAFSWLRGLLQASLVLVLHIASDTSSSVLVQYFYWLFFLGWVWLKVEMADRRT